jgi:hypothetical protein
MKKLVKNFNNLIKRTIFKVQNKTNSNFTISNFNKYLIAFISLLFFYLFYLSIPVLYDKNWLQSHIEKQLLKEFKINFSASSDIAYRILPTPHFLLKDSKIFKNDDEQIGLLSEIKTTKIFIYQGNFLNKEKIQLKEIKINNANFSLLRNDFKLLSKVSNSKFSNKKIKINKSNIFLKNNEGETISIIKIDKAFLFFDKNQLLNLFKLKAEIFKIPFIFDLKNKIDFSENKKISITAKKIKLNIFNESSKEKNNFINGKNIVSFLNSKINTEYNVQDDTITFESGNSRVLNSKIKYKGELSINPFDLNLNVNLGNYKISSISKILNNNSILADLVKTELLFNDNISVNTSIITSTDVNGEIFQSGKINFDIINGRINLNKTRLINTKIGSLELENSNLFVKTNMLVLNSDIIIDINNSDELFSLLQTNVKSRKLISNIVINLDYNFLTNQFKFNNIKIDNKEASDELLKIIEGFNDNNFNTFNKSRRLLNALFEIYEG